MISRTRFVLAATIGVIAIVFAGAVLIQRPQNQVGSPSPTPTLSPVPVPQSWQGSWASVGTRSDPIGHHQNPPQVEAMVIDAAGLRINAFWGDATSSMAMTGPNGQLTLHVTAAQYLLTKLSWDCTTGDTGTYDTTLSPDEQTLTLRTAGDQCTTRGDILTGAWTRWSCPTADLYAYCDHASELAPGRYVSPIFRPFGGGTTGQLAYTVPSGWAKSLQPPTWPGPGAASVMWLSRFDAMDRHAIEIFSNIGASGSRADRESPTVCSHFSSAPTGTDSQTADFLASLWYLSVSGRTSVTLGGLAGVQIDVSVLPGFRDPCSGGPEIEIFHNGDQSGAIFLASDGDANARLILLDSPVGHDVIVVSAPDKATLDRRLANAMPVINSFEFIP